MQKNPWLIPDLSAMTPEERLDYEQSLKNDWSAPVSDPVAPPVASAKPSDKASSPKKEIDPKVRDYMMKKYFSDNEVNSSQIKDGMSFLEKNEGTTRPGVPAGDSSADTISSASPNDMTPEERTQKARDKAQMLQYAGAGVDLLSALMPKPQPQVFLKGWNETGRPTQTQTVDYKIDSSPFRDAARQVKSDAKEDQQIADDQVTRADQVLSRGDRDRARQADISKQDPTSKESQAAREYLKHVAPNATKMAGFDGLSAAQVEKIAPSLYAASNAAEERKARSLDRAALAQAKIQEKEMDAQSEKGQWEKIPKDKQEIIRDLSKKNATKMAITNQIDAVINNTQNKSKDEQLQQYKQLIKTLNSVEGSDAVGAEESRRLAGKLDFALGNLTNGNPIQFGRDLEGFRVDAQLTSKGIRDAIVENQRQIDEAYGRTPTPAKPAPNNNKPKWAK